MSNNQTGQSIVEFAVSIIVVISLILSIPILAKIANANILSIQALDYAAWRVREGNTDNQLLTQEVSDRYFGETALIVDNEKINQSGVNLGTGRAKQQIYTSNSVSINYTPTGANDTWNSVDDAFELDLYKKQGSVSINLPLENLSVVPEISDSMTIKKSLFIDNQSITARDNKEIQNNIEDFDNIVLPYNSGVQEASLQPYNLTINTISLLGRIDGVFEDHNIDSIEIDHNAVPADRLEEFRP